MKKTYKVLSALVVVFMLLAACTSAFAVISIGDVKVSETKSTADTAIGNIGSKIITAITSVGVVLSVIVIAILGIKYMMGSTEEKAEYKKTMLPYLVGAILVFGASTIGGAVINMGESLVDDSSTSQTQGQGQGGSN